MGSCEQCGGYLPPVKQELHIGEYISTQYETAQVMCYNCNIIYIIDRSPTVAVLPKDKNEETST